MMPALDDVRVAPAAGALTIRETARIACAATCEHYGEQPCWEADPSGIWQPCRSCEAVAIWHAVEVAEEPRSGWFDGVASAPAGAPLQRRRTGGRRTAGTGPARSVL